MEVLLCTPLDVSSNSPGGISVWAKNILDYYAHHAADVKIDLVSCDRSTHVNENTSIIKRFYAGVKDYTRILASITKKLKCHHYDIVHVNTTASISLIKDIVLSRIIHKQGSKMVLHFHFGRIPSLSVKKNLEWILLTWVVKKADKVIVMDNKSFVTLRSLGFNHVYNIANPYSYALENQANELMGTITRNKHRVLFIGRVFRLKGIYELVEACKNIPNIQLRMVGPYEEIDKKKLIEITNGDPWLEFVGPVPHDHVIRELMACDIFVLPSYTEGFPNAILESMICKTPTIATTVGAIPEMLDLNGNYPCGIPIRPRCSDDIKEAIVSLIDNEELKSVLVDRAYLRVTQHYSPSIIGAQLFQAWEGTLSN